MTTTPEREPRRGLTRQQVTRLMTAIDGAHVETKQGMSYIAQHQARAEMTRIFGVGNWDSDVETMELLYETVLEKGDPQYPAKGTGKPYYVACYKSSVRVNVRDYWGNPVASFREYHAEENAPLPNRGEAHAMAITSAESYALRRALIGLGDRLGLGLYDKGKLLPLVVGTLQLSDPESPLGIPKAVEPPAVTREPGQNPAQGPGSVHQGAFKQASAPTGTPPAAPPGA